MMQPIVYGHYIEASVLESEILGITNQKAGVESKAARTFARARDCGAREVESSYSRSMPSKFLAHHSGAAADFEHRAPENLGSEHTQTGVELVFDQIPIEPPARVRPNDLEFGITFLVIEMALRVPPRFN